MVPRPKSGLFQLLIRSRANTNPDELPAARAKLLVELAVFPEGFGLGSICKE